MAEAKTPAKKQSSVRKTTTPVTVQTAELLLEIGCEELPYQFIPPALTSLKDSAEQLLKDSRLSYNATKTFGTPRRLVLAVEGLTSHQTSTVKEAMGPSKAVAFDQTGQPTKAAIGFATGQGVAVQDLQARQTAKGEYVFAVRRDEGRPTKMVLLDLLPQLIASLSFPKSMHWNDAGIRFARPVRWLVAMYGGGILSVEIAGVKAGNRTVGHRVLGAGKSVAVRDFRFYTAALKRHGVLVDQDQRRTVIREQLGRLCQQAGVHLNADEELLEQAVFTTEWPIAILGSFKADYLAVPPEILITSMKEHQGFFSVRNKKSGALAAHFVAIVNNERKDMSLIREGNERVLAARLADAKFFYDDDRRTKLWDRAKTLTQITFHHKLGNLYQKQERIKKLAGLLAPRISPNDDALKQTCEKAASLCKADLLTGIVGEFPTLQGIMGGEYAKHDGEPESVNQAIKEQYLPRTIEGEMPKTLAGKVLSLADRLDTISAFFHVGIVPTGSEDPFALRRHATAIVRLVLEGNLRLNFGKAIDNARNIVTDDGFKWVADSEQDGRTRVAEFIFERVRYYGRTVHGLRDDVMEAVLKPALEKGFDLVDLLLKMQALQTITAKPEFDPLIIGFKRAHRLVEKEKWDRKPVDSSIFKEPAETELHRQVGMSRADFDHQMEQNHYQKALDTFVQLKPAIDTFFAAVMVNADDPALRNNRLSLLKDVDDLFMSFADFSQIVVQGC